MMMFPTKANGGTVHAIAASVETRRDATQTRAREPLERVLLRKWEEEEMKMRQSITIAAALTLAAAACDNRDRSAPTQTGEEREQESEAAGEKAFPAVKRAIAIIQPTEGNKVHGTVRFEQQNGRTAVKVDVQGLEPNSKHGFHVHQFGDCSAPDASSAGDHYAPEGHKHALPHQMPRHAGDMGNIVADKRGTSQLEASFDNMSIAGEKNPILGRAVIIHAQPDVGEKAQPSGSAGKRLGCGVIGVVQDRQST